MVEITLTEGDYGTFISDELIRGELDMLEAQIDRMKDTIACLHSSKLALERLLEIRRNSESDFEEYLPVGRLKLLPPEESHGMNVWDVWIESTVVVHPGRDEALPEGAGGEESPPAATGESPPAGDVAESAPAETSKPQQETGRPLGIPDEVLLPALAGMFEETDPDQRAAGLTMRYIMTDVRERIDTSALTDTALKSRLRKVLNREPDYYLTGDRATATWHRREEPGPDPATEADEGDALSTPEVEPEAGTEVEPETGPMPEDSPVYLRSPEECSPHHWVLGRDAGETDQGVCKHCGTSKEFPKEPTYLAGAGVARPAADAHSGG